MEYQIVILLVVVCVQCQTRYHNICARDPVGSCLAWRCSGCRCALPTNNRNETPVCGMGTQLPPARQPSPAAEIINHGVTARDSQEAKVELAIRLFREELQEIRREIFELRTSLPPINARMDDIESQLDDVEDRTTTNVADSAVKVLEQTVANLQSELHQRDQERLNNDVLISNVREKAGENVTYVVTVIGCKLGVAMDERDIVSAERLGMRREGGRPRPIAVRLVRRATRGELLRAARVLRSATMAICGLTSEEHPFYVYERLTRRNQELFQRARELCRRASWRFVWTRDGRIFVRRAEGERLYHLRQERDLEYIF